jgi:hypothetical protein
VAAVGVGSYGGLLTETLTEVGEGVANLGRRPCRRGVHAKALRYEQGRCAGRGERRPLNRSRCRRLRRGRLAVAARGGSGARKEIAMMVTI